MKTLESFTSTESQPLLPRAEMTEHEVDQRFLDLVKKIGRSDENLREERDDLLDQLVDGGADTALAEMWQLGLMYKDRSVVREQTSTVSGERYTIQEFVARNNQIETRPDERFAIYEYPESGRIDATCRTDFGIGSESMYEIEVRDRMLTVKEERYARGETSWVALEGDDQRAVMRRFYTTTLEAAAQNHPDVRDEAAREAANRHALEIQRNLGRLANM